MAQAEDPELAELKRVIGENAALIHGSRIFLCPINKGMTRRGAIDAARANIPAIIQMGIAVFLDKPVLLLVPESLVLDVSDNVKRLAYHMEIYRDGDMDDCHRAAMALLDFAMKNGIVQKR